MNRGILAEASFQREDVHQHQWCAGIDVYLRFLAVCLSGIEGLCDFAI